MNIKIIYKSMMKCLGVQVPYSLPVPKIGDVFSYQLSIHNRAEWVKWDESLDPSASLPRHVIMNDGYI